MSTARCLGAIGFAGLLAVGALTGCVVGVDESDETSWEDESEADLGQVRQEIVHGSEGNPTGGNNNGSRTQRSNGDDTQNQFDPDPQPWDPPCGPPDNDDDDPP